MIRLPAPLLCRQFGIGRITPLIWSHSVTWKGAFLQASEWLEVPGVVDVFSVSACINNNFAEYITDWKHTGYRLFDSPELIREVAAAHQLIQKPRSSSTTKPSPLSFIMVDGVILNRDKSIETRIVVPIHKQVAGFDVVTFPAGNAPECSPLSCNGLAKDLPTNAHCLFAIAREAARLLNSGAFTECEPGPYRVGAVCSVDRP